MFRSLRTLAAVAVASTALVACSDNDSVAPVPQAQVRIVHASPDAPAVDVQVDDFFILTNVPFRAASPFLDVDAGERRIRVRATGGGPVVIDATVPLDAGRAYTVLATGLLSGIAPVVAEDNLTNPPAGQVKLRVVHAAPAAAGVDVYATAPGADLATATPVLTNVPFGAVSDYLTVPAGEYQIRVTPTGTTTVAIDATLTLEAGAIRTVVAKDAPGGGAPLAPVVLVDN